MSFRIGIVLVLGLIGILAFVVFTNMPAQGTETPEQPSESRVPKLGIWHQVDLGGSYIIAAVSDSSDVVETLNIRRVTLRQLSDSRLISAWVPADRIFKLGQPIKLKLVVYDDDSAEHGRPHLCVIRD